MQSRLNSRLHVLRLAGVLLLGGTSAVAQSGRPTQDRLVHDDAQVMQPAVAGQLEQQLRRYADSTGVELAVVTVNSLHGREIGQVGDSIKNAWGIGSKQTQRGLLYLIAPSVPRQTVRTGRGLEADLPDALCFRILKQSQPTLRQDPQAAILSRVAAIQRQLAAAARVEAAYQGPTVPVTAADEEEIIAWFALLLLLFGAGLLAIVFVRSRQSKARQDLDRLAQRQRKPAVTPWPQGLVTASSAPRRIERNDSALPLWPNSDDSSRKNTDSNSIGWGSSSFSSDDTSSNSSFSFGGDMDTGGGGASSD